MMIKTTLTGYDAETLACEYLKKQGLLYICRNYSCALGEIDLIMKDKNHLVFIEVRMRQNIDFGAGLETISRSKQRKITGTALHYLQKEKLMDKIFCRFDVISIKNPHKILWIQNAFQVK